MKKILLPYIIIPAVILGLVTVCRAWLEVHSPEGTATHLVSASYLTLLWLVCVPAAMLKKGLSLWQGLLAGLVFFALVRVPIGVVYAMAWKDKWTVEGTGEAVRYVTQTQPEEGLPDPSALQVFFGNLAPIPFILVPFFVIWAISWVICFRGKRPFAGSADAAGTA